MTHEIQVHFCVLSAGSSSNAARRNARADENPDSVFALEQRRAALRILNVFARIAARSDAQLDFRALEAGLDSRDALLVRMVESFRDAQQRRQRAHALALRRIERRITRMMSRGLRLAVVVADYARNHVPLLGIESGDIGVAHQILAVLVMAAMVHDVPDVMQ